MISCARILRFRKILLVFVVNSYDCKTTWCLNYDAEISEYMLDAPLSETLISAPWNCSCYLSNGGEPSPHRLENVAEHLPPTAAVLIRFQNIFFAQHHRRTLRPECNTPRLIWQGWMKFIVNFHACILILLNFKRKLKLLTSQFYWNDWMHVQKKLSWSRKLENRTDRTSGMIE